jgi:hypothetical protein
MYADDLVLLARNERDLQAMLHTLYNWCTKWQVEINMDKSNVMHFRNESVTRTNVEFTVGCNMLKGTDKYKYLGLMLSEYLDMRVTADHVAKAASRSLGLLIAKSKALGGMPFNCFKKLYESMVLSVIHYGSAIWGHTQFSSINAVHNRACRYFLGVGKYTPNAAVQGDTGLPPPWIDQWVSITRNWCRITCMNDSRLNKKIFLWSYKFAQNNCKNLVWKILNFFRKLGANNLSNVHTPCDKKQAVQQVGEAVFDLYLRDWEKAVNRQKTNNKQVGNKLRLYRTFKHVFETESYMLCTLGRGQRSALAKFRGGVAPIRLETGRYEGLQEHERLCPFCKDCVESEIHTLLQCTAYIDLHGLLFESICKIIPDFMSYSDVAKLEIILASNDEKVIKTCAKICQSILSRRRQLLYN